MNAPMLPAVLDDLRDADLSAWFWVTEAIINPTLHCLNVVTDEMVQVAS